MTPQSRGFLFDKGQGSFLIICEEKAGIKERSANVTIARVSTDKDGMACAKFVFKSDDAEYLDGFIEQLHMARKFLDGEETLSVEDAGTV